MHVPLLTQMLRNPGHYRGVIAGVTNWQIPYPFNNATGSDGDTATATNEPYTGLFANKVSGAWVEARIPDDAWQTMGIKSTSYQNPFVIADCSFEVAQANWYSGTLQNDGFLNGSFEYSLTAIPSYGVLHSSNFSCTISGTTMTASAPNVGSITYDGSTQSTLYGAASNTKVTEQLTGTPGGAGTYTVSVSQTVSTPTVMYQRNGAIAYGPITDPSGNGQTGWTLVDIVAADSPAQGSSRRCEEGFSTHIAVGDEVWWCWRQYNYPAAQHGLAGMVFVVNPDYDQLAQQLTHDTNANGGVGAQLSIMYRFKTDGTRLRSFCINAQSYRGSHFTATIDNGSGSAGTVLTVAGAPSVGTIFFDGSANSILSGTGITANTHVTAQVSGTPGGAGVYTVDKSQLVASEAMYQADKYNDSSSTQHYRWAGGKSATAGGGYGGNVGDLWDPNWGDSSSGLETWIVHAKFSPVGGTAYTKVWYATGTGQSLTQIVNDTTTPNCIDPTLQVSPSISSSNTLTTKGPGIYLFNQASNFSEVKYAKRRHRALLNQHQYLLNAGYTEATIAAALQTYVEGG